MERSLSELSDRKGRLMCTSFGVGLGFPKVADMAIGRKIVRRCPNPDFCSVPMSTTFTFHRLGEFRGFRRYRRHPRRTMLRLDGKKTVESPRHGGPGMGSNWPQSQ